jgi:phospholipid/cholesterol/gamma-HCH transport system ATP-binding protein
MKLMIRKMIEIKDITKAFNGKAVLKGVSSTFKEGEINLIIGGSGTGKSVLLKGMIGLIKPDQGNVLYNGRDFYNSDKDTRQAIRREMGVLFQGGALFDSQTVEENVRFPLDMLTDISAGEKKERVEFCLQRVGLEAAGKRMPSEISGGMKKRVGIARAIVMNPKYLFCDEPNSGLDPLTSVKIDELIKEITDEYKITTVIITHDMNSVMEIGQNVMFLYQGDKLWEGVNSDITKTTVPELKEFIFANKLLRDAAESNC